ncbi:hypothetical protein M9H77_18432 [Catharanthus roseus]|uniref:Uncharacterized protein n=1 Tax=Catharanthus roseus TaxID=4058 RepID=A0ACC0B7F1_CATRO|nr:hypothetical protein M9H77_18432 [Catharanthus roseus]
MNLDSSTGANVQNKLVSSVMVGRDNNGKSVSGFDPASKGWEVLCKWRSLQLQIAIEGRGQQVFPREKRFKRTLWGEGGGPLNNGKRGIGAEEEFICRHMKRRESKYKRCAGIVILLAMGRAKVSVRVKVHCIGSKSPPGKAKEGGV